MDMLWNLIRDFIVMHITGGVTSLQEQYVGYLGNVRLESDSVSLTDGANFFLPLGGYEYGMGENVTHIAFADWLATTLTIISLIFILVACVMFVVKIVKLVGNLVK